MEIAEPSIRTAFAKCVSRGADKIICYPYFLSRGRHVTEDIPNLIADAAKDFPHCSYIITPPLGKHNDITSIIYSTIKIKLSRLGE